FGGAIGGSVVCLGYILLSWLSNDPAKHPAWVLNAQTLPAIQQGANFLRSMVPGETREAARGTVDRAREAGRVIDNTRSMTIQDLITNQVAPSAPSAPPAAASNPAASAAPPAPPTGGAKPATPQRGEAQQQLDQLIQKIQQ
ncbi:MAG: hypothetical protein ACOVVK_19695, partial [Elsteraceae bacterium]